jgi:hypothetical protein
MEITEHTPVNGDNDVTFCIKATNIGNSAARDVQYQWLPRSGLELQLEPPGFLMQKGEHRCFQFVIPGTELVRYGLLGKHQKPLGIIELRYHAGWHAWKRIDRAIYAGKDPELPIRLGKIPRRPLGEIVTPIGYWQDRWRTYQHVRTTDQHLQQGRLFLEDRGIEVNLIFPQESFDSLMGELAARGWYLSYETLSGDVHMIGAKKTYPPSTSRSIRALADTPLDAATVALVRAIKSDDKQGSS